MQLLTVALCTHNPDLERLERTLAGLDAQSLPRDRWEFVIIDNRSDPPVGSLDPVSQRGIRVVRELQPGLTAARERAAREAAGDVIVFPDDDTVLAPDYLERAIELMADQSVGMLSGNIEPEYATTPPAWFWRFEGSLAIRCVGGTEPVFAEPTRYSDSFPLGAGCVIRTAVLREHAASLATEARIEGRRGTELTAGEDLDIALFCARRGLRVGVCGRLRLKHLIPAGRLTEDYLTRLLTGAMRSSVALERKWRRPGDPALFPFLHAPRIFVFMKMLAYRLLFWRPEHRIRFAVQRELLRLDPGASPRLT